MANPLSNLWMFKAVKKYLPIWIFLTALTSFSANAGITGFEYIGSISNTTHVWNDGAIKQDYYFFGKPTLQVSNDPDQIWEFVYHGVSWGTDLPSILGNYVEIGRYDGNVTRVDRTDNLTFVNITASKNFLLNGKNITIAKNDYIGTFDNYMMQNYWIKSFDTISTTTWFVIHRSNISISGDKQNDFLQLINKSTGALIWVNLSYAEENNLTLVFNGSLINSSLRLIDNVTTNDIFFSHEFNGTAWFLAVIGREIYIIYNAGTFSAGQSKALKTFWVDAACTAMGTPSFSQQQMLCNVSSTNCSFSYGETLRIGARYTMAEGDYDGDFITWQYRLNETGIPYTQIPNDLGEMNCSGDVCQEENPVASTWYYRFIKGQTMAQYNFRTRWTCGTVPAKFSAIAIGDFNDTTYPVVSITANASLIYFNSSSIQIIWNATDNYALNHTTINFTYPNGSNVSQFFNRSNGTIVFGKDNLTTTGTYTVRLKATDLIKKLNSSVTFTFDVNTSYPIVWWINITPNLSIDYFSRYSAWANITLASAPSGKLRNVTVNASGINGDNVSCYQYLVNGTCLTNTSIMFNMLLNYSSIYWTDNLRPDSIYPEIAFASNDVFYNNSPSTTPLYNGNFHMMRFVNNFTIRSNTSLYVEFDIEKANPNLARPLEVYLVSQNNSFGFFQSNWRTSINTSLIGTVQPTDLKHHNHSTSSQHYLIRIYSNPNGTFTSKGLNVSQGFWIVFYLNQPATLGWLMSYQPTRCNQSSNWYAGNDLTHTITLRTGCPDNHVHIVRLSSTNRDGVNLTVVANDSLNNYSILSQQFYFLQVNHSPQVGLFTTPLAGTYEGNVSINWTPCLDIDGDTVLYNLSLHNETSFYYSIVNNSPNLTYVFDSNLVPNYASDLAMQCCDTGGLCNNFSLFGGVHDFNISNIYPNATMVLPVDGTNLTNNTINVSCNASDNINLSSMAVWSNVTGIWTQDAIVAMTGQYNHSNWTYFPVPFGADFRIACRACDWAGHCNMTGNVSFNYFFIPSIIEEVVVEDDDIVELLSIIGGIVFLFWFLFFRRKKKVEVVNHGHE